MEENPAALVAVIARLLPKDFQVTIAGAVHVSPDLSDEQRARIAQAWLVSRNAAPVLEATTNGPELPALENGFTVADSKPA